MDLKHYILYPIYNIDIKIYADNKDRHLLYKIGVLRES